MTSRIDDFIRDSRPLVGKDATDVSPGARVADWLTIRKFCAALGDPNPLYKDPAAALATKYNSLIAPNTFVYAVRTPNSVGTYVNKNYGVVPLFVHASNEWVDVIRVGDRLSGAIQVTDVREGTRDTRTVAEVVSTVRYQNSYGGLVGTAEGTVTLYPIPRAPELILERDIYEYSDDDIQRIERDIEAESQPRGRLLRYWDDVAVGESLPQLVKGPVTLADMMAWVIAESKEFSLGPVAYRELREKYPGRIRANPMTGWPFSDADGEFEDILSCRNAGFRMPVTRGQQRAVLAAQICTGWMGDDGFLRRLEASMPGHWCYGDTMWINAQVARKQVDEIGSEKYLAVEIGITGTNQLDERILDAHATVYLPNPGHTVSLPVPH